MVTRVSVETYLSEGYLVNDITDEIITAQEDILVAVPDADEVPSVEKMVNHMCRACIEAHRGRTDTAGRVFRLIVRAEVFSGMDTRLSYKDMEPVAGEAISVFTKLPIGIPELGLCADRIVASVRALYRNYPLVPLLPF